MITATLTLPRVRRAGPGAPAPTAPIPCALRVVAPGGRRFGAIPPPATPAALALRVSLALSLAALLLASATGCSRFRVMPVPLYEDDRIRDHMILINSDGRPVLPTTAEGDRKPMLDDEYNRYLDNIQARLGQYVERKQGKKDKPRIVIFVHGGLNSLDETVTRYQQSATEICRSGAYPLFIGWDSGLVSAYYKDLLFVRQGEDTGWIAAALSPFLLCFDLGAAAMRWPVNIATMLWTDLQASDLVELPITGDNRPQWYQFATKLRLKPRAGFSAGAIYERFLRAYVAADYQEEAEAYRVSLSSAGAAFRRLGYDSLPEEREKGTLRQWATSYIETHGGISSTYKEDATFTLSSEQSGHPRLERLSEVESLVSPLTYLISIPWKATSLLLIDAVGDRAWRSMRRRTMALFYPPRQFNPWRVLHQPTQLDKRLGFQEYCLDAARKTGTADDDLSEGALALFVERLRQVAAPKMNRKVFDMVDKQVSRLEKRVNTSSTLAALRSPSSRHSLGNGAYSEPSAPQSAEAGYWDDVHLPAGERHYRESDVREAGPEAAILSFALELEVVSQSS